MQQKNCVAKGALIFLSAAFFCRPAAALDPKYGPPGQPLAVPLASDNAYFRAPDVPAPDFWLLSSFYVPQFNDAACSAAAAAMVMNALLNAGRARADSEKNISQEELIGKIKDWQALISKEGLEGRRGVSLSQAADFLEESLKIYGSTGAAATKHEVQAADGRELKLLREYLAKNEKSGKDFMIIHFTQDDLTLAKGGPYPHLSPVGAYDAQKRRALIFDVDREWYEPYWVSDEALLKAMARSTAEYGKGGFIYLGPKQ